MNRKILGLGLISASVFLISNSFSNEESSATATEKVAVDASEKAKQNLPANAGRTATIDPQTGELRSQSNADQFSRQQTTQQELPPVKYTNYENGTVGAKLNGRFRTNLVATINCDGKLETKHVDDISAEPTTECDEK